MFLCVHVKLHVGAVLLIWRVLPLGGPSKVLVVSLGHGGPKLLVSGILLQAPFPPKSLLISAWASACWTQSGRGAGYLLLVGRFRWNPPP